MSSMFETDDDLSLRTRRGAEERGRDRGMDMDDHSTADREVTLNTGTVLALFFALALICAVFFGFGYSMGRKSTQAPVTAAAPITDSAAGDNAGGDDSATHAASDKPAPGSPAIQAVPGYMSQQEANDANGTATKTVVATKPAPAPEPTVVKTAAVTPPPAPVVRTPAAATPAATAVSSAPVPAGAVYVQIAAVSHQEDADVLKSALSRRGYKVVERSDANDRLIHVQIGPFTDRKAADATRQKLLGDGYNAFLK